MYLCEEHEFDNLTTKQFEYPFLDETRHIFVVKWQGQLRAYENSCPHTGVELNWQENVFLNYDKTTIQRATHGAQFRFRDGLFVCAPRIGQFLKIIPLEIVSNKVYLRLNH